MSYKLGKLKTKQERIARRKRSEMLSTDIERFYGLGQNRLRLITYRHQSKAPCIRHHISSKN